MKATTAGTILTVRHAMVVPSSSSPKKTLKRGKRTVPMTSWVTPPPRLPHPPTRALAVPTTSFVNIRLDQNWHITKVPPAIPMKRRRMARPAAEFTRPVIAVGIEAQQRTIVMRTRAPYLSQAGPRMKRMQIVPETPTIDEVQSSFFSKSKLSWISERRGATANQMKKAMKKPHQEQWKARMCGRAKLQSLISVALSSWSGSTLMAYVWYFLISVGAPDSASDMIQ
mmetsp:Transcript_24214/g.31539  ORF Transcript_24214/g.31539 Transcript_24214/m.31539 type:complete len:226 (+) Transcript_24214:1003-1680(+)